jgi:hypothetical protein
MRHSKSTIVDILDVAEVVENGKVNLPKVCRKQKVKKVPLA